MKKLMLTATAVFVAVVANAASMSWGQTTKFYTPDTEDGTFTETSIGSKATAYLFEISAADYAKLYVSGDYEKSAANVFEKWATVSDEGKVTVSGASQSKASSTGKVKVFTDSRTFYTGGAETTAYAAMIIKTTGDDGKDYYIANLASHTFAADADFTNGDMALWQFGDSTGTAITGWTQVNAVPEPFSGALALLGMGAIALRRKMKKAKKA